MLVPGENLQKVHTDDLLNICSMLQSNKEYKAGYCLFPVICIRFQTYCQFVGV